MNVTLKLFADLRKFLPEGSDGQSCVLEIDGHTTVDHLLKRMKISDQIPMIILVNYTHAKKDQILANGDVLSVFPPIAGGGSYRTASPCGELMSPS